MIVEHSNLLTHDFCKTIDRPVSWVAGADLNAKLKNRARLDFFKRLVGIIF